MGLPLQLTILRQADSLLIDLAEVGSLIPRSEIRVDEGFLQELVGELQILGETGVGGASTSRDLERIGGLISSHLLTEQAREHLRRATPGPLYLRLDEEVLQVPWELCHDGEQFLASRFQVGRQVITGRSLPPTEATSPRGDNLRVLLVADPTESLTQVTAEAERLCELLDAAPNVEVTLMGGRSVRRIPLLAALGEHDVVHFAGHSHYDTEHPERSGWRLHEGLLTAEELSRLRPAPALVFSNSCEAGATTEWSRASGFDRRAFGIGSAFLFAGVRNYIGTFWVVHDEESAAFATACYRALASGHSLGTALHAARESARSDHGASLTWASYLLYGDPTFVPFPAQATRADSSKDEPRPPAEAGDARPAPRPTRYSVGLTPTEGTASLVVEQAPDPGVVVGREAERGRMQDALERARSGVRQTVFLSGPAGIGKTTLVDTLRRHVSSVPDVQLIEGQSIQQYGAGEGYLPFLEALGHLAQTGASDLPDAMRRIAPTWLAQLPRLVSPDELEELRSRAAAATQVRMLREMAELIETLTVDRTLVIVLEDLHWADHSTVDLVAYLAERRSPARLLLVGTYRESEVMEGDHFLRPVVQELTARSRCERLSLTPLSEDNVARYLERRLVGGRLEEDLAALVHQRTEGHPLFLTNVVDFALREGLIVEEGGRWEASEALRRAKPTVPDELRQLIERQLEALGDEERSLLEAASVVGAEFSVAEVSAALETPAETLEPACESLAWRGRFLREAGVLTWPDGTVSGRYRFLHALYVDVLYRGLAPLRRRRLHAKVAERKASAYGDQTSEIAGQLAQHFEAAGDLPAAVHHHEVASDSAMVRHASHEAQNHLEHALRLLPGLPESPGRNRTELMLLIKLAAPITSTVGWAATELGPALERARALASEVEEGPHLFPLLRNVVSWYQVRGDAPTALEVGEELLRLAAQRGDDVANVQALYGQGVTLYALAKYDEAESYLESALDIYRPATHLQHVSIYGDYDPGVSCRCWLSWVEWLQGKLDGALATVRSSIEIAASIDHPFTWGWAHLATAIMHLNRGEAEQASDLLDVALEVSIAEGFRSQIANTKSARAWLFLLTGRSEEAGALIREAIADLDATGTRTHIPRFYSSLAISESIAGRTEEALELLNQAVHEAETSVRRTDLPGLYRTRGGMLLRLAEDDRAAHDLERGLELAREYRSPTLVLQAVRSLVPLRVQQGRASEVRRALEQALADITGGETTSDVLATRQVLARLAVD